MVRGTLAPEAMSPIELVDHLPVFLDEVIAALRADLGLTAGELLPEESESAAVHGGQRLRLGFSLDSVVREYGALRDAILATGKSAGADLTFREVQVVFDSIVTGIADAVSEYSRQRDAELQRQHNEHFAFLAHELRSPLYSAKMGLDILKRNGQVLTDSRPLHALERGLQRMQELIDHSLKVARVASGIDLRPARVRLRALLEDAETLASTEAEEKAVELRVRTDQDDDVYLDLRLVRSALNNLVRNAVKYSHSGGVVELRGSISGTHVCIEIEDSCGGLPPGDVEQAFAPFVRMNNQEDGFGLGLAIAKQAVDAHGGAIRVQNVPGKGCIFALEFPIAPVDPKGP